MASNAALVSFQGEWFAHMDKIIYVFKKRIADMMILNVNLAVKIAGK